MDKKKSRGGAAFTTPDFKAINERALANIGDVIEYLNEEYLDGGKYTGVQFLALNPHRDDHNVGSFSLNTETGVWADFATEDKGSDIISFWAFVKGIKFQSGAAEDLETFLNSLDCMERYSDILCDPLAVPSNVGAGSGIREAPRPANSIPAADTPSEGCRLWTPVLPGSIPGGPNQPYLHPTLGEARLSFRYRTHEGKLIGRIDTFGTVQEQTFKALTFWQNAEGDAQWRWDEFPEPWPLYGLETLAARPKAEVVICDSEEAADSARDLLPGCVVVCPMYGARCPHKTDLAPLRGRHVTLWPSHSATGKLFSEVMVELLEKHGLVSSPRVLKSIALEPDPSNYFSPNLLPRIEIPDGWDAAYAVQEGWSAGHMDLVWSNAEFFISIHPEEIDGTYRIKRSGVYAVRQQEGQLQQVLVCSYLKPLAQTRDSNSTNWGLLLELTDADNRNHQWAMPISSLMGTGQPFVQPLVSLGLRMPLGDHAKANVAKYLNDAHVTERALCVSQLGWYQSVFVMPEGMIGSSAERVVVQTVNPEVFKIFRRQGTHAEWSVHLAAPCQGNSRLAFCVSAALTSPVLYWLNAENGGFHLRGNSSIGKTVALAVAVSVWGGPDFLQRWRATANGLEATATRFNDTFLALDELSQIDATAAGEAAYMLGNGQGKARAQVDGMARPVSTWRLIFLSTGEVTLADHSAAAGKRTHAGQEARMVNIPADAGCSLGLFNTIHQAPSPTRFAEMLRGNSATYFGTAGPLWIELLADPIRREAALDTVREVSAKFSRDHVTEGAVGQVQRAAGRFGMVAGVGEACIRAGILPWPTGEAISAARECFYAWIEHRGGTESFEAEEAVNQVRRFIENHGEARFTAWDYMSMHDGYNDQARTINRAGFRRLVDGEGLRYYIFPEAFRKEICQGMDAKEVAKVLVDRGFLIPGHDGKATTSHRLPGLSGTSRVYLLSSAILTGGRTNIAPAPVTQAA